MKWIEVTKKNSSWIANMKIKNKSGLSKKNLKKSVAAYLDHYLSGFIAWAQKEASQYIEFRFREVELTKHASGKWYLLNAKLYKENVIEPDPESTKTPPPPPPPPL